MRDGHNAPFSTAPLSSCRLVPVASFMKSIYLMFGLPLVLPSSVFPSIIVFLKEPYPPWCASSRTASGLLFLLLGIFQAEFSLGHTCSSFWWSGISVELSPSTIFQMNQIFFFFTISLLHCPALYPYMVIMEMRVWIFLALVSNDVFDLLINGVSSFKTLAFFTAFDAIPWDPGMIPFPLGLK